MLAKGKMVMDAGTAISGPKHQHYICMKPVVLGEPVTADMLLAGGGAPDLSVIGSAPQWLIRKMLSMAGAKSWASS